MADIMEERLSNLLVKARAVTPGLPALAAPPLPAYDLIELLFFAYRDFVGDADRLLADYGFGRAHHRVIHFVSRRPGLTIAELLDLLRITKQSLNRVLKELIDTDFVEQRAGLTDRRQRLLFVTPVGEALALELSELQSERINRALRACPEGTREGALSFLQAMVDQSQDIEQPDGGIVEGLKPARRGLER